ncbi:MAG: fasciclin domain-containing protein [Chitinophagaceae bacterium]
MGVYKLEQLQDGQQLGQVNGSNISIKKSGTDVIINGKAKVIATVSASNGIIYVIDEVLSNP